VFVLEAPGRLQVRRAAPDVAGAGAPVALVGLTPNGAVAVVDDDPRALRAGQTIETHGVRLLALPDRCGAIGALVVGVGGHTLLWAVGADGALADDAVAALDGATLEAAVFDPGGPHGPEDLAAELSRLRRVGAVTAGTDLVATGLSGMSPDQPNARTQARSQARLEARLRSWGVRTVRPGEEIGAGADAARRHDVADQPQRTVVLGAASSGKSVFAEDLLAAEPEVVYLATGPRPGADDPDWADRVARHTGRRPPHWRTVEVAGEVDPDTDTAVAEQLASPGPAVLLDSLGGWVSHTVGRCGGWDDTPGWSGRWDRQVQALVAAWRSSTRRVVVVAEETGWGVVPASASGRLFRDRLGALTTLLVEHCDRAVLVVAGRGLELD
jgi:adenosylcobinamide kinase/adenosylcobinamide-phosphate guanylyltransferase